MATEISRSFNPEFSLHLASDVRRIAEEFSAKEGLSLDQFINLAIAEKLAHLQHQEWMRTKKQPTEELARRALEIMEELRGGPVELGDELPEGYVPIPRLTVPTQQNS